MLIEKNTNTSPDAEDTGTPIETVIKPDPVVDDAAKIAAEKIARFKANAALLDQKAKEDRIKKQLMNMTETEKTKFLNNLAINDRLTKMKIEQELIRETRIAVLEAKRLERERQTQVGISYQDKLAEEALAAREAIRMQKEAEDSAAEAIILAEQAKNAADAVASEAERLADEARRRTKAAESQAKELAKKAGKSINPKNWKI